MNYSPSRTLAIGASLVTLSAALVACGGGGSGTGAGGTGAGTSTSSGAAGGGGNSVGRVLVQDESGRPLAGITVVLHGANGEAKGTATTDDGGAAEADVEEGGGVSVLLLEARYSSTARHHVRSVMGVPHGSEVRIVTGTPNPQPRPYMTLDIQPPSNTGEQWDMLASCRDETMLGESGQQQYWGCPGSDTYDVVIYHQNGTWQTFPDQPYGGTQSYQADPAQGMSTSPLAVTIEGLPASATYVGVGLVAWRPDGGHNANGRSGNPPSPPVKNVPQVYLPPGGRLDLYMNAFDGTANLSRHEPLTKPETALTWKLSDVARVESVDGLTGTIDRPIALYKLASNGTPGQAVRAIVTWTKSMPSSYHSWEILAPPGVMAQFPELPAELAVEWTPPSPYFDSEVVNDVDADGAKSFLEVVNAEFDRRATNEAGTGISNVTLQ